MKLTPTQRNLAAAKAEQARLRDEQAALLALDPQYHHAGYQRRLVYLCRRLAALENRIADLEYASTAAAA